MVVTKMEMQVHKEQVLDKEVVLLAVEILQLQELEVVGVVHK